MLNKRKTLRKIYYRLSPNLRFVFRKVYFFPHDIWSSIWRRRNKYEPLKGDIFVGFGDFTAQGIHHLELLKTHIFLEPENKVLDIGSGIGRTAVALTKFLNNKGKYEGFDVVEKGVKWCNDKIKKENPNFNFIYVPLNNDLYNTNKVKASTFKFPYDDNSFDKVFLLSVFTHMLPNEIKNYLFEIKRVLKPGGLCLSTFFIYNSENEEKIINNGKFSFPFDKGNYKLMSNEVKSANIALKDKFLEKIILDAGLRRLKTIEGFWKIDIKNQNDNDFQDIIVMKA